MMQVQDFVGNVASTPMDYLFQDGLMEIGIGVEDTEDIFGDILKGVGNVVTAPFQAIGKAVSGDFGGALGTLADPAGLFKTGGPTAPSSVPLTGAGGNPAFGGGGLLGGLIPGGGPGGILGNITQGIGQALGMGGAQNPLGSMFGAGIGGTIPGTGPLPGALGQAATNLFGQPNLPPRVDTFPTAAYDSLAQHTEKAGRAIVRRILGATAPELRQIRQLLAHRRNQIQATAEHRQLNAADAAHREVLGYLGAIANGSGPGMWKRY